MEDQKKMPIGVQYGLIIGILYCILVFLRYNFFSKNPLVFAVFAILAYFLILIAYFFSGYAKRRSQGGYIEFKEAFQTIFISIVFAEIAFVIFNFIYLKYIDPDFFKNFSESIRSLMEKQGASEDMIDQRMKDLENGNQQFTPINTLKGLGTWIVIDSLFGFVFAFILKKKKDIFENHNMPS